MMKRLLVAFVMIFSLGTVMAQSVAHINSQKVLDTMPSYKQAYAQLEKIEKSRVAELQKEGADLERAIQRYQTNADSLGPTMYKYEGERLAKKQRAFQQKQQEYQEDINRMGVELNKPIMEKYNKAVKAVVERKKISYVLEAQQVVFAGGEDITSLVITEVLKKDTDNQEGQ